MRRTLFFGSILTAALIFSGACGGGGGSSGGITPLDVDCAPPTLDPTINVSGDWQIAITNISPTTCLTPPNWITCDVTLSQSDTGDVTITSAANCTVSITISGETIVSSNYTSISAFGGAVDVDTFYWLANLSTSITDQGFIYSETDTVTCAGITSFADGAFGRFDVSVSYTTDGVPGTCSSTATVTFTQI